MEVCQAGVYVMVKSKYIYISVCVFVFRSNMGYINIKQIKNAKCYKYKISVVSLISYKCRTS